MGAMDFHKTGQVWVHLDKDKNIIGVEIPKESFRNSSIIVPEFESDAVNTKGTCTKGLANCCREVMLESVHYILVTNFVENKCILTNVVVSSTSLQDALKKHKMSWGSTGKNNYGEACSDFMPVSSSFAGVPSCFMCATYDACMMPNYL